MIKLYSKAYEMPFSQFIAAHQLFSGEGINFSGRVGFSRATIEILDSQEKIALAEELLQKLWITKESTIFPKRHMSLVKDELESWGIDYKRSKNPFVFEIITEIDQRKLDRFVKNIKEMTKKPKRKGAQGEKRERSLLTVPDDARELFE